MLRRAALIALAASFLAAAPAQADTLIVATSGDTVSPGTCPPITTGIRQCTTLRDAIATSNDLPGLDQIALPTSEPTLQLTNPTALVISDDLTIAGPGAGFLTVGGSGLTSRVFETSLGAQVSMTGFTIGGGFSDDTGGNVLVSSPSSLTLTGVRIRGGQADFGGGIAVRGTLLATNSLIDGNSATEGGGLYTEASGAVSLTNVTIANNQATFGGGIFSTGTGLVELMHVTIGRNTGAGLTIEGPANVQSSIVASNSGPACEQTTFSSVTTSVAGDASCGFPIVADPGLSGALVDTGGEFANYVPDVLTIPEGSPAEDAVAPCLMPFDQRFGQRFLAAGAPCDAGAYERVASSTGGQPPVRPRRPSRRSRHPRPHRRRNRRPSSASPWSSSLCAEPCSSARAGRRSARRCAPARRSRSVRLSTRSAARSS